MKLKETGEVIYLLGDMYYFLHENDKAYVNEKLKNHLKSTIYFGYKSKFFMLSDKNQNISSDAGWGCMLRVGQMMLAQAFKKSIAGY